MKKSLLYVLSVAVIAVLFSSSVLAQENRRAISAAGSIYVVSAEAGGVNFVEGKVVFAQKDSRSGYLLKGDKIQVGDKVSTGAGGRAEILLNPGSFARLGENSEFEFLTTSLDDLQLKLNGGSAIFEVITDNEFTFAVTTPNAKFYIVKTGVYRIDVLGDGTGRISVWKGAAQVGDINATQVKSGREAVVNNSQVAVAKFDRDDKDALEVWSKERAKELSKINARLERNSVRSTLINSFNNNGWNLYNSYGLWLYNPTFGSYCFLPFGHAWTSPYGYFYPRDLWYYRLPTFIYYQPPPPTVVTTPTTTGTVSTGGGRIGNTRRNDEGSVRMSPPFERVQREIGRSRVEPEDRVFTPAPIFIPAAPPPPAPVTVAPSGPPTRGRGN